MMNITGKKIFIVCDSSRSLLDFRGKLIEKMQIDNQVYVFTPRIDQESVRNRLKELNVITYESNLNGSNVSIMSDLQFIYALYKLIRKIKPDIFFPYTFKPVIYGSFLAKLCKVNLIAPMLTGLGYNFTDNPNSNKWVVKITRFLLKFSLQPNPRLNIIFQNKDDSQRLLDLKILNKKHQVYVVNGSGVDLSHYEYSKPSISPITFLMVSRLINAKGIKEYYDAAKLIKERFPQTVFKLIGPYDDNIDTISPQLYQAIASGDTIKYIGQVDDVRPDIEQSSVMVLPSYYGEGVPRCVLEGMAMGRPVITSDSVGCRETINPEPENANGFLIPIKNASALASKMTYFIENSEDIVNYGNRGRIFAKEKFDVNLVNSALFKIMKLES
ncbi:glycosyltransferase family 4 protein [Pedobacter rhizosphaerae]|uniref:Glycosyltransferase involved in cell wall bisynthesis n=1 Tax=Pedobacter rhizosphaerae TaxID=390241 RepID=A0A1H9M679_9SPHI|nr:glycosyltransferase family 4 protein [Pedobacter rhizosphaerae]SER18633.1 Glycosyltransferase involved in cell wall bisynthesis [Pedobacter rhizosphaerae]